MRKLFKTKRKTPKTKIKRTTLKTKTITDAKIHFLRPICKHVNFQFYNRKFRN